MVQRLTRWRTVEVGALIVIACLGTAVVVPAIAVSRESARQRQCLSNLRRLGHALHEYHDAHGRLPPAAVWRQGALRSSMLMETKRIDLITYENWARLLLPYLDQQELARQFADGWPVLARANEKARNVRVATFTCASDVFNRDDNRYSFEPWTNRPAIAEAARGNYAINGGTHNPRYTADNAAQPHGDGLSLEHGPGVFRFVGSGVAGVNRAFRVEDFTNGQSTLVAMDEIRAGIHRLDPRGVWSLGQIGGSISWGHGVAGDAGGPNNPWPRADDILGCARLQAAVGSQRLLDLAMPCVDYVDRNDQATARSMHPRGAHVLMLDGAARFVRDEVDRGLWHVMHSRETPPAVLEDFDLALLGDNGASDAPGRPHPGPGRPLVGPEGEGGSRPHPGPLPAGGGENRPHFGAEAPLAGAGGEGAAIEPRPGETMINSLEMRFVAIPAGTFTMGLPDIGNDAPAPPECPSHEVTLSNAFWMGAHEVTQRQFEAVMADNPSHHLPQVAGVEATDDFPVENVTWHEAEEFCRRLGDLPAEKSAGRRYRLPTEAEWEYACRSGQSEPYRWAPQRRPDDRSGAAAGIAPPLPLAKVGSYPPNAFGIFDMRGNVWEWCADWFDRDYYSHSPRVDPPGPAKGFLKVVRGGDWIFVGEICRINYSIMPPWQRSPCVGFRVVCSGAGQKRTHAKPIARHN